MKKNYGKNRFPKGAKVIIRHGRSPFHGKEGICEGPENNSGTKFYVRFGNSVQRFVIEGKGLELLEAQVEEAPYSPNKKEALSLPIKSAIAQAMERDPKYAEYMRRAG